jgi:hypothetical protein
MIFDPPFDTPTERYDPKKHGDGLPLADEADVDRNGEKS